MVDMNYTLDQLQALEAIHRLGSFAAAAKSLYRATSAVSYAIKTLETALGVSLFDRSGHRAVLTASGELVLAEARRVLAQARRLEQVSRELQSGYEPQLQVVVDGILPQRPLMKAMQGFSARRVSTRVRLMVEYLNGVSNRFAKEKASMMIVLDYEGSDELSAIALPPVDMFLVVHREHPVLEQGEHLDRAALADHVELVVADSSVNTKGSVHRLFLGSPHLFQLSDFYSKREALLHGVGYGWLPAHLARPHMRTGDLVVVPFEEGAKHTFEPHLVYRKDPPLGPGGRLFMELYLDQTDLAKADEADE